MYGLTGILGLFGLTLLVLLVVSRFTEKAKPQATRAGTPSVDDEAAGWGPWGFLFPKSWVYVWWGFLAMVLFSAVILPKITEGLTPSTGVSTGAVAQSETIETILSVGPFIHAFLMPFLWAHKHREVKKRIENEGNADVVETSELDPEAKTVIFSMKLGCGQSCTVLLADLTMGLVEFVLWAIKRGSLGTINLNAFWFPSPFYTFWKAKMHIGLIQIDGAKICTTANQGDAYMKFCTEAMLNFWTLGIYGMCCGKRTSYGRWLDRHVLWQGAPPRGYTNQFRIFDEKLECCQLVKVYFVGLLLSLLGGFLSFLPIVGGLWPFGLVLPWYLYTVKLGNMKFGGSDPTFVKEFTWCNYIIKYYTIGICGLCGQPVKVWVDKCIVMGEPTFDQEMANQDSQADSVNPNELSQRFTNQLASGSQTMSVQVLPGLQGGMPMQVQTPNGVFQVQIPPGLQPGMAFEIQVPRPASVVLTAVNLDLERGAGAPATEEVQMATVVQAQPAMQTMPVQASSPSATPKVDTKAEEKAAAAAAKQAAATKATEGKAVAAAIKQVAEAKATEEKAAAAAAKQAKAAEEKAAAAAAKESAAQEAAAKKASAKQAEAQAALAAKVTAAVDDGTQVLTWLTEKCDVNASDAKLYADAMAELGIDTPEDLHMVDGVEVAWPSVIKPVHRKKIQAALESSRKMPLGRKMSDTI